MNDSARFIVNKKLEELNKSKFRKSFHLKKAELDIIDKSGAWFSYESTKLGQGRENAKAFLKENLNIADEITAKIRENMGDNMISSGDDENESEEE